MIQKLRNFVFHIESGLAAGLLAAISTSLAETFISYSKYFRIYELADSFLISAFSLLLPMLLAGLGLSVLLVLIWHGEDLRALVGNFVSRRAAASSILGWGLAFLLVFWVLQPVHDRITDMFINDFKNKALSGWMLNLGEYLLLAIGIAMGVGLSGLFVSVFKRVGLLFGFIPHRLGVFLSLALVVELWFATIMRLILRIAEPFEGIERISVQTFVFVFLGLFVVWALMLLKPTSKRRFGAIVRIAGYSLGGFILVYAPYAGRNPVVLSALNNHAPVFRMLAPYYVKIGDLDGDRFGSFMGGADSAMFDPWAYPGAPEVKGNGKDDNCILGDEPKSFEPKIDHGFVNLPDEIKNQEYNILFITMDAVRADHLSCYGYKRKTTPNIDKIASQGTVFERAYSQGTGTIISVPSFMSGLFISQIECQNLSTTPEGHRLAPSTEIIADYLRKKGYLTIGVAAHGYLSMVDCQDWDIFSNPPDLQVGGRDISSPDMTRRALEYAKKYLPKYKTFMWVHYFDPHDAYMPHPEIKGFGHRPKDLYDGELKYTDKYIGKLVEEWNKISPLPTVIIIAADHGESLGEHGIPRHNMNFYEAITHVPLILYIPGAKQTKRIKEPVALIDIFPTLRNLMGDEPNPRQFGHSLLAGALYGRENPSRIIFHEAQFEQFKKFHAMRAITTSKYRFIWDMLSGAEELYDLRRDPKELKNLVALKPDLADEMRSKLYRTMEDVAVTIPQFNWCNYRPKKKAFRYYPKAPREFYEDYVFDKLPKNAGKRVKVSFDDKIELLAYNVSPVKIGANRVVKVRLFFKSLKKMDDNYKLFVHLRGKGGGKRRWDKFSLNYDHYPVKNLYPVVDWNPGEIIEDEFEFEIPRGRGEGVVNLFIGFYSPQKKERLKITTKDPKLKTKDNRIHLAKLRIQKDVITAERIDSKNLDTKTLPAGGSGHELQEPADKASSTNSKPYKERTDESIKIELPIKERIIPRMNVKEK